METTASMGWDIFIQMINYCITTGDGLEEHFSTSIYLSFNDKKEFPPNEQTSLIDAEHILMTITTQFPKGS
jgi:hypothetical protein